MLWGFSDNISTLDLFKIISFILFLSISSYLYSESNTNALPPGPINLPIIGYIPFMMFKKLQDIFKGLKKQYGDIVYFRIGSLSIVILNSYEVIREALVTNCETSITRPTAFSSLTYISNGIGIGVENGKEWKDQRRFLNTTFRDLGAGKQALECHVREEASVLIEEFRNKIGKPFDPHHNMQSAAANIVSSLTLGIRYRHDDPDIFKLLNIFITLPERIGTFHPLSAFPCIRFFLPRFLSGISQWDNIVSVTQKFANDKVQEHIANPQIHKDYIGIYLKQQKDNVKNRLENSIFDDARLRSNILALGAAGTTTTAQTLTWAMKCLIRHPEVQQKLHEEIDTVIGSERVPCNSDRPNMPYMDAFIVELHRYADVGPFGVPHSTTVPTTIAGYKIPKGVTIIANLFLVHRDEKIWGDPDNFRPERFLDEEGKSKIKYVIPFGMGKRSCPGENISKIELFIFLASILFYFTILPASDEDLEVRYTESQIANEPAPFNIKVVSRNLH